MDILSLPSTRDHAHLLVVTCRHPKPTILANQADAKVVLVNCFYKLSRQNAKVNWRHRLAGHGYGNKSQSAFLHHAKLLTNFPTQRTLSLSFRTSHRSFPPSSYDRCYFVALNWKQDSSYLPLRDYYYTSWSTGQDRIDGINKWLTCIFIVILQIYREEINFKLEEILISSIFINYKFSKKRGEVRFYYRCVDTKLSHREITLFNNIIFLLIKL